MLPDLNDVTIITSHFNFCGYSRPVDNYYKWKEALGLPVVCVELSLTGEFETDADIRFLGDESNIMWQKEALLNIGLRRCKTKYAVVMDHDLIFENRLWLAHALCMLEEDHFAVQCFNKIRYLDKDGIPSENLKFACVFNSQVNNRKDYGVPGGAWAFRTETIKEVNGLIPNHIIGGGDRATTEGMLGNRTIKYINSCTPSMAMYGRDWRLRLRSITKGLRVGYVHGAVNHLYHGDREDRKYFDRKKILKDHKFDCNRHIKVEDTGVLSWTEEAPVELRKAIKEYFEGRKEDGK